MYRKDEERDTDPVPEMIDTLISPLALKEEGIMWDTRAKFRLAPSCNPCCGHWGTVGRRELMCPLMDVCQGPISFSKDV